MKKITVFTPTYNRAYCLKQLYDSLVRQTNKDFIWLLIDDGSKDNTHQLFKQWKSEGKIDIDYIYKENGGMHSAYNTAFGAINTELNVCVDSDDYLADEAIDKILKFWSKYGDEKYSGIVGLDADVKGHIIGKKFPKYLKSSALEDLYFKHKIPGDKKLIYRTEVVKEYPPFPLFTSENFVPLGSLFIQIDQDYELLCLNEILTHVEYLPDGSTKNIFKQYRRFPQGFRYSRLIKIKYSKFWEVKIKSMLHLISCHIQLKDVNIFKDNHHPFLTLLLSPFGFILYVYILYKSKQKPPN